MQLSEVTDVEQLEAALPFTYACFNETLRLVPPVFASSRVAQEDLHMGKYVIRKGVALMFNIVGMHRNPKFFANPEVFQPERFVPGNPEMESRPKGSFLPFGLGPRNCIGYKIAQLSALLFLAQFLARASVTLDDSKLDKDVELNTGGVTMSPLKGVWLRVSK